MCTYSVGHVHVLSIVITVVQYVLQTPDYRNIDSCFLADKKKRNNVCL